MAEVLDAAMVRRWSRLAADALGRTRAEIDAINVFPVADADTGTNLHLTVLAAADAVEELAADADAAAVWRALARGALLGAHGNSGVILSQFFRGLADTLTGAAPDAGPALARALESAAELARAAVEHPVEGTILSVLHQAAAAGGSRGSATEVARAAADGARRALRLTTEQLDVLARSGVVDAGAAGLCVVLDTLAAALTGELPERYEVPARAARTAGAAAPAPAPGPGPGYEVMYLLDAPDGSMLPGLRETLDGLGDSLVVVGGDGLWNVHVHVDDAGAAVEAGIGAGRPYRIRVTYLHATESVTAPCTGRAVVAVTAAEGLAALFESGGARVVRREPGTVPAPAVLAEAMLGAGDEVVVLPNEPEVLAVAEAAAGRARDGGVQVEVVPTRASVQGLAALAVHDPLRRFGEDVVAMTRAAGATRFGHLEVAAGEAFTSVGICRPGDVVGMIEGDVAVLGDDLGAVARQVLDRLLSGGGELVTLVPGAAAPAGLAGSVEDHLRAGRPDVEVLVYDGGQERYPLLIGVE